MHIREGARGLVRWALLTVLVIGLLAQAAPRAVADSLQEELNRALERQERLAREKKQAENDLQRIKLAVEEATAQLQVVEAELALASSQYAVVSDQLAVAQDELKQVEAELEQARQVFQRRKEVLAARIRAIREGGRVDYLGVLLGATSFSDFIGRFEGLKLIVQQDAKLFEQIKQDKLVLEEKQRQAQATRDRLVVLKAEAQNRLNAVEAKRAERRMAMQSLKQRKAELERKLDEYNREGERLAQEIYEIQRRIARAAGRFQPIYPVDPPIVITDSFGPRLHPILGTWRTHYGTDFAKYTGEPVYAIEDGVVITAGWNDAYGWLIVIDHGGGISSWYGHSSRLLVSVGDEVRQGQKIALVGSTGWSTGPHVHLEIHVNGKPEDPMSYIKQ